MSIQKFDAIIVGGGPAGSTMAWRLARGGRKAIVLDRAKFPRVKICAGWITPGALRLLELKPSDYPHTIQSFKSGEVVVGQKYYETHYHNTASYGIIRKEFDHFLLQRAAAAGASVRDNSQLKRFERHSEHVEVELKDGSIFHAPLIIGAGGTGCPIARAWSKRSPDEDIIIAAESETRLGSNILKTLTPYYGTTELFTEPDGFGYGWYVTKGDWLNIGVGRFQSRTKNFNIERERFMQTLRKLGRLENIEDKIVKFGGHSYKIYDNIPRQLVDDRFMCIGDAAGFASRWAGEGIKPAIHSGIMAAETALFAHVENRFDLETLSIYETQFRAEYGEQRTTLMDRMLKFVPDSFKRNLIQYICKNDRLRRKFVFDFAFGFEEERSA